MLNCNPRDRPGVEVRSTLMMLCRMAPGPVKPSSKRTSPTSTSFPPASWNSINTSLPAGPKCPSEVNRLAVRLVIGVLANGVPDMTCTAGVLERFDDK